MDVTEEKTTSGAVWERLRKSWFPPAAVMGAFAAFIAAAFRIRPEPKPPAAPPDPAIEAGPAIDDGMAARRLDRAYALSSVLGGAASAHPFRQSLAGIAVGAGDAVYALGDNEVRVFDAGGNFVRSWKAASNACCIAAAPDGRICLGAAERVEIYDAAGKHVGGFTAGEKDRPADITAIKILGKEILVADASARIIRRYDATGRPLGLIGTENKTGKFILPNKSLDIAVDARGVIRATDTGRHQVTAWALDGTLMGKFGKFGMADPADFVGCCNPVNLAITPDSKVVTAEKMVARVKVYEPDGRLLGLIGPENFDPACIHIHLAVDAGGRILAADPVRREIRIFARVPGAGPAIGMRDSVDRSLVEILRA